MNIDHKQRFMNGPYAKEWATATGSEAFVEAQSAALLIMVTNQNPATPGNQYRLEGAREILGILLNLTTERPVVKRPDFNLQTNV